MKKSIMKRILTFVVAIAMVLTSAAIPSVQAEAASAKKVKSVKLKIGSSTVTNKKYTMTVGQKKKLKVTVAPKAAKKSIAFKTSKKKVAAVDKKGKITAKSAGKAKITVTVTGKNKKKVKKNVTIVVKKKSSSNNGSANREIAVTGVTAAIVPSTINVGESAQVTASVAPANATNKTLTYSSSNSAVAAVNNAGAVIGMGAGTATITVKSANGKTASVNVTVVNVPVKEIQLNTESAEVTISGTVALKTTILPENATNKAVKWMSEDETIASVSVDGVVTGHKVGSTSVYAIAEDGSNVKSSECKITVKSDSQIANGITLEVTNPYKDGEGKQYNNTVIAGKEMHVRVSVGKDGTGVGNATVALALKAAHGNLPRGFEIKSVSSSSAVTTDANGIATFAVGPTQDYSNINAFSGIWQSYTLTAKESATNAEASIPISFAAMGIREDAEGEYGALAIENNHSQVYSNIEPSDNASESDDGIYTTQKIYKDGFNGEARSLSEEYVTSQQYSTNTDSRKVYLSIEPYLALPATEENARAGDWSKDVESSSGKYTVYNDELNETTTTIVEEIPGGLEYMTLCFDKIMLSKYSVMYIDLYDLDGVLMYSKKMDVTNNSSKSPNVQIRKLGNRAGYLQVSLVSQGLVDVANEGYELKRLEGRFESGVANEANLITMKNVVKWEETSDKIGYEPTDMTLDEVEQYLPDGSKYLNGTYTYKRYIPTYPRTGNAYIEVFNADGEVKAWYLYPTVNNGRNVNVLAPNKKNNSKNIHAIQVTEKEACTKGVGTIIPDEDGNVAVIDSKMAGVTNIEATLDIPGISKEELDSIGGGILYSSVQWVNSNKSENKTPNEEFYAIEGQSVKLTAQLFAENGDETTMEDESIDFYYHDENDDLDVKLKSGDKIGGELDEDGKLINQVTVILAESRTDSNGRANLTLKGENIDFVKGIYAASEACDDVKLSVGTKSKLPKADIYWVDLGVSFMDSANEADSPIRTTTFSGAVKDIERQRDSKVGNTWDIGYQVVARSKNFDYVEFQDKTSWYINEGMFDRITNVSIFYTMTGVGEISSQSKNVAVITSSKIGAMEVTGTIDTANLGENVRFTYYDEEKRKHEASNVGTGDTDAVSKLGLKFTMNWSNNGIDSQILTPDGTNLYMDTATTVYVQVKDMLGNPRARTSVSYMIKELNETFEEISAQTDSKGILAIPLEAPGMSGKSVITFNINNDTTKDITLTYNDESSPEFGLASDDLANKVYAVERVGTNRLKVKFTNQVRLSTVQTGEFTFTQLNDDTKYAVTDFEAVKNDNTAIYLTLDQDIKNPGNEHTLTIASWQDDTTGVTYELLDNNGKKITGSNSYTFTPSR